MTAHARILIVEDETIVAMDLAATLRRLGYEVVGIVGSGDESIDRAGSLKPDLILMDIRIKGPMDGIEAAAAIQLQGNTPIVFLTAHADVETVERAKGASPYGYLVKPFDERELHRSVEIALQRVATDKAVRNGTLDALWHSEERFRLLVDAVKDYAIFLLDLEGRIASWNPGAEKLTGYAEQDVLGKSVALLGPPELKETFARLLEEVRRAGSVEWDDVGIRKDGSRYLPHIYCTTIADRSGELLGYVNIVRDVTELREQEREIARLTRLYAALSHVNQAIVWSASRSELFDKVSRALVEQGGFRMAWIGWHDPEAQVLVPVAVCGDVQGILQKVVVYTNDQPEGRSPAATAFIDGRPYICNDMLNDPATRPWRDVIERNGFGSSAAFPIRMHGSVRGTISVIAGETGYFKDREIALVEEVAGDVSFAIDNLDRTEARKRAEAERQLSDTRYRSLFDYAPDGILIADAQSNYIDANVSICRMLGYTRDELIGMHAIDIVVPDEVEHIDSALKIIMEKDYQREWRLRRKDGTVFVAEVIATLMPDGNILAMIRDVTEHRSLQAQLVVAQKFESLGQLAGGVAHDFNNMLMVIFTRCDLLLRQLEPGRQRQFVSDIRLAAMKNRDLTQQLLAAARRQVLAAEVVNVNDVVATAIQLLAPTLGEQVTIRTELDERLWHVYADPGRLHQVLLNLVINARDAMPQGGTVTIESRNLHFGPEYARKHVGFVEGDYVSLVVSDTGSGISKEIRDRIYDPFFTTKEVGRGTGLGLSVVRGIIEQTGGRISMYSEEGKGTTFKVLLPRHAGEKSGEIVADEVMPERGSETILLVEDDALLRAVVRETLEEQGYQVLEAPSPMEALRLSESHAETIHLLLTDVIMPGLSGDQLAEAILEQRPAVRVIFMSGYTSNVVLNLATMPSKMRFLEKPIPATVLLRLIRAVLDDAASDPT